MRIRSIRLLLVVAVLPTIGADYSAVGPRLEQIVREEMREWNIGGISVALVDGKKVVHAAGFGDAKRDSIFRVGSISKLFNAVAVMQQVEAGHLDLDAPIPVDLLPVNPFPGEPAVTLRQLLSHRSGLPRESPVGGYMDLSEPGIAATVASLRRTVLVTVPAEKTRYSNIAPTLAGHMVERATGRNFEDYQHERVLGPLRMTSSAWTLRRADRKRIVASHIRVTDGRGGWRRQKTPLFDLGTIPAGNLFSTVDDLARFASALMEGGGGVLKTETLEEMWRPQFTDQPAGFGLGFMVGKFREHRTVSHSGAVYGHSTSFVVLPEKKVAVIVLGNEDIANGRIRRLSREALSLLLEAKEGEAPPEPPASYHAPDLPEFAGEYESESYWARLEIREGQLVGDISGQPARFRRTGEVTFLVDNRIEDALPLTFQKKDQIITGFTMGGQRFERVSPNRGTLPKEWLALLGVYGPKLIPIVVTERHGHLYAMTENMVDYRLTPVNANVCSLPPGMYVDEEVVFLTNPSGKIHAMNFANMIFDKWN